LARVAEGLNVVNASSLTVAWAISQYRQALSSVGLGRRGQATSIKAPSDPPEVLRYLRAIGIGRNIDAYA
jgi:hypothetical protein